MGREHAVRGAEPFERCGVERDELLSVVGGHAQILATIGSAFLGFLLSAAIFLLCDTVRPRCRATRRREQQERWPRKNSKRCA